MSETNGVLMSVFVLLSVICPFEKHITFIIGLKLHITNAQTDIQLIKYAHAYMLISSPYELLLILSLQY